MTAGEQALYDARAEKTRSPKNQHTHGTILVRDCNDSRTTTVGLKALRRMNPAKREAARSLLQQPRQGASGGSRTDYPTIRSMARRAAIIEPQMRSTLMVRITLSARVIGR